jgi:O-antigen/teichoic acid export membrane protein
MMLLAGIAQLNLMSALLRFVPTAGARAGRLIVGAYLVGGGLSALAAAGFLAGLRYWAPGLSGLLGAGLAPMVFVVATALWALFVMQDSVLVAVGRAGAVPVANLAFGWLKLALLPMLALAVPLAGIWVSWVVATSVAVAGTTGYLGWRAMPAFAARAGTGEVAAPRELRRFIGPDYLGALAWIAASYLTPLVVLALTDPARSAVFALAWSICIALYHVPAAFGQALVANAVLHRDWLDQQHRQALRHTLRLLVPVVALVAGLAPFWLSLFGLWYAEQGVTTLRLLALSAIPNAVVALAVSRARVERRMRVVVAVLVGVCVLVLGLTTALVPHLGIAGAALAWLVAQLLVAAVVLAAELPRRLVRARRAGIPRRAIQAVLASGGWRAEHIPRALSDTAVIMVGSGVLKVAASPSGTADLAREHAVLAELQLREPLGDWRALIPVPLEAGDTGAGAYLLTTRLPGHPATGDVTWRAIEAIGPLHRLDRTDQTVTPDLVRRWVDEPAARVRRVLPPGSRIDALAAGLRHRLAGRRVTLGWTHGDFHPDNVLADGDRVSGIVDWSQAREHDLAALDLVLWLLTVPRPGQPRALGARVAARLTQPDCFSPSEQRLLDLGSLDGRTLLLLAWLRHVGGNLAKSQRYATSPIWLRRNVLPVLRQAAP